MTCADTPNDREIIALLLLTGLGGRPARAITPRG